MFRKYLFSWKKHWNAWKGTPPTASVFQQLLLANTYSVNHQRSHCLCRLVQPVAFSVMLLSSFLHRPCENTIYCPERCVRKQVKPTVSVWSTVSGKRALRVKNRAHIGCTQAVWTHAPCFATTRSSGKFNSRWPQHRLAQQHPSNICEQPSPTSRAGGLRNTGQSKAYCSEDNAHITLHFTHVMVR